MDKRFIRNIPTLSEGEQLSLGEKRAVIVGCGGLGGHIAELLVRAGVGKFTLADGDCFEESNLNRQLLSLPENLGQSKAETAARRIEAINERADVRWVSEFFSFENADNILAGADIVMDALDNIDARLLLEEKCAEMGLSLVHGAVEGWSMQCCVVEPGSGLLKRLYGGLATGDGRKSVLSPIPAICAGIQCAEAIKLLCGRESTLSGKLLCGDGQSMEFYTLDV